ncbi:YbhB/YbcL family Raf kinase inhibitor-like protein [Halorutilales archaeon Cl-col2-1]
MRLSSPAFEDGGEIPREYGYTNRNVSPPLEVDEVPDEAESLVLIVDDPDAVEPAGKVWDHWVVWNLDPSTREISEDADVGSLGGVEAKNDYGDRGYGGPNPPDREHSYRIRIYAVDTTLDIPETSTKEDVLDAVDGHVVSEAGISGRFSP